MHKFSPKNLRNPARERFAGAMRQFPSNQLDSTTVMAAYRIDDGMSHACMHACTVSPLPMPGPRAI
jgi:hypothetical protein